MKFPKEKRKRAAQEVLKIIKAAERRKELPKTVEWFLSIL